jgi:hypothetical protein
MPSVWWRRTPLIDGRLTSDLKNEFGPSDRMRKKSAPSADIPSAREPIKPHWDAVSRKLWYGDMLVKRFRVPAEAQCLILTVFQEEGWPSCIDDPLPCDDRSNSWHRLKKAIHMLNESQENPLITFHGNGTGDGVCWEYEAPK